MACRNFNRSKRRRYLKHQNKLKHLHEATCNSYPSPVMYTEEKWIRSAGYVKNPKPYYKRLYRGKRSKYLKQQSNKKIRRYKGDLHRGNMAHKLFDFWRFDDKIYNESLIHSCDWWTRIGCETNQHMKVFMEKMKSQGKRLGLISQTDSYIHMVRKNEWVLKNYGIELENCCVAKGVSKIEMMEALSSAYQIDRKGILLVDDKETVLIEAITWVSGSKSDGSC